MEMTSRFQSFSNINTGERDFTYLKGNYNMNIDMNLYGDLMYITGMNSRNI